MTARRIALLLAALLVLAGCSGGGQDEAADDDQISEVTAEASAAPAPSEPADTSEPAGGAAIETSSTDLGDVLVDGEGMTLYVFDNDSDGTSSCYDDCESNWPPLTGDVTAGDGVDDSLLGTTERDDGTVQVTYADQPLYHFAGDQAAGDVNGQAVGGIWWVVAPDGEKITDEVGQADSTTDDSGY